MSTRSSLPFGKLVLGTILHFIFIINAVERRREKEGRKDEEEEEEEEVRSREIERGNVFVATETAALQPLGRAIGKAIFPQDISFQYGLGSVESTVRVGRLLQSHRRTVRVKVRVIAPAEGVSRSFLIPRSRLRSLEFLAACFHRSRETDQTARRGAAFELRKVFEVLRDGAAREVRRVQNSARENGRENLQGRGVGNAPVSRSPD